MPTPLIAKRPTAPSSTEQAIVFVLIGGPLIGLWYCWQQHRAIHFDNPWVNLSVHAALFILPLIWAGLIYYKPVVYESRDGETILGRSTFFDLWPVSWWEVFMMWAAPVVALVVLGHAFFTRFLPHPENLSTTPGRALILMVVTTGLGLFYAAILLSRSEPATWVSDAGLRTSILRFHEWKDIHHISQHGRLYVFYHYVNPALPAGAFKVRDGEAQAVLERYLSEHHIRILNDSSVSFYVVKIAVVLGFASNVAFVLWLKFNESLSSLAAILISFGLGIAMTLVLEKFRGVSKYGKHRPIIEPPQNGGTGDVPGPSI